MRGRIKDASEGVDIGCEKHLKRWRDYCEELLSTSDNGEAVILSSRIWRESWRRKKKYPFI